MSTSHVVPMSDGIRYMELTVVFLWLVFLWEMYLHIRQHRMFKEKNVPKNLEGVIGPDEFEKARIYGEDKSRFSFFRQWFDIIETTLIFALGGLPFIWDWSGDALESMGLMATENEILRSILFIYAMQFYQLLVTLPWSLYFTFVVEERHAMNKCPVLLVPILYLIMWSGPYFYVYVWAFVFCFSIASITVYTDYIAPMFDRFEPLPDSPLRTKISALAESVAFPASQLLVVYASNRSSHSNAYFIGFFKNKKIVLFDTLFKKHAKKSDADANVSSKQSETEERPKEDAKEEEPLFDADGNVTGTRNCSDEEVVAILGHELGHWKLNHTLKMFALNQVVLFTMFMLFGHLMHNASLYASFGFDSTPTLIGLILIMQFVFGPINIAVGFLFTLLTRMREYEADEFAVV
ncbi:hypothetical protein SARC_07273 [Sphaeroforma arctica JP610]|uniref:CAAX prenyl protease n=1 Tax=Sphaeroforma arctica JP610 TaxID=667725 RepID=A0A0L0FWP1_9EUKA|nr:hypothetical protein SARC_07273 [Sphaeroforma arctica JP610]KNC80373.1 hypothetical protein SARC_07273 [Sphaeroforma arctica JP610]|eukprot:XP_014154275.1 hypothetical protein SARC_07273 [Sphaeroforma arctica JP610]